MEKKQRAPGLLMAHLEALTGAMKNTVVPAPQPPLPEAAAGTEVMRGAEIGTGTKTATKIGIETETETETKIKTGSGSERALSAVSALVQGEGVLLNGGWWGLCSDRDSRPTGSDSFPERRAPRKGNTLYVYGEDMTPTLLRGAFSPFGNIIDLSMDPPRK